MCISDKTKVNLLGTTCMHCILFKMLVEKSTPSLPPSPPFQRKGQKSPKPRQRKNRLCQARVESKSELEANILRLCYICTYLALKVPGKKSNPLKKCVSRKISGKENADRGMPKSKSKYRKCLQKELETYF